MLTGQAYTLQGPMVQISNSNAEGGFSASESGFHDHGCFPVTIQPYSPAYQDTITCGSSSLRWSAGRLVGLPGQTPLTRMPGSGYSQPGPGGRVPVDRVVSSAPTVSITSTASTATLSAHSAHACTTENRSRKLYETSVPPEYVHAFEHAANRRYILNVNETNVQRRRRILDRAPPAFSGINGSSGGGGKVSSRALMAAPLSTAGIPAEMNSHMPGMQADCSGVSPIGDDCSVDKTRLDRNRRRSRIRFSYEQNVALRALYAEANGYPSIAKKRDLAARFSTLYERINLWFVNERCRVKKRKGGNSKCST